jgi:hypothetical protein
VSDDNTGRKRKDTGKIELKRYNKCEMAKNKGNKSLTRGKNYHTTGRG